MPRRSLERIALARLFVGGCAVVFGACVLIEQARAEHSGGGGGIPARTPSDLPYAMPQPRYKPLPLHYAHLRSLRLHPCQTQHSAPFRDIALRRQ